MVFELDTRAEPSEVFARHLAALLLGTGVTRAEVRGWPGVAELLSTELGPGCSLSAAKRLAARLVEAREEPATAARRVRVQLTEYADEAVAQWFRGLDSLEGALHGDLAGGAERDVPGRDRPRGGSARADHPARAGLAERARAGEPPRRRQRDQPGAAERGDHDRGAADRQRADRRPGDAVPGSSVPGPGASLRLAGARRGPGGDRRAGCATWGRRPRSTSASGAAVAVGVLACDGLDFVHNHVIAAWAASKDADARDSAAVAVGPPAEDPVLRHDGPLAGRRLGRRGQKLAGCGQRPPGPTGGRSVSTARPWRSPSSPGWPRPTTST